MSRLHWPDGPGRHLISRGTARFAGRLLLGHGARAILNWVQFWRDRRRTRRTLSNLPDEILADIGIERSQIHLVAKLSAEHPGVDIRSLIERHLR